MSNRLQWTSDGLSTESIGNGRVRRKSVRVRWTSSGSVKYWNLPSTARICAMDIALKCGRIIQKKEVHALCWCWKRRENLWMSRKKFKSKLSIVLGFDFLVHTQVAPSKFKVSVYKFNSNIAVIVSWTRLIFFFLIVEFLNFLGRFQTWYLRQQWICRLHMCKHMHSRLQNTLKSLFFWDI